MPEKAANIEGQTLTRIEKGELTVLPPVNRALARLSGAGILTLHTPQELAELFVQNPGSAVALTHTAYAHPDLVVVHPRARLIGNTYDSISEDFPGVLSNVSDTQTAEIVKVAPQVSEQLSLEHEVYEGMNIPDSALLLHYLITTATARELNPENYPEIVTMGHVYDQLASVVFSPAQRLSQSVTEDDNLRAIGQSLLIRRRMIELQSDESFTDDRGNRKHSSDPRADFNGSVASIIVARRALGALTAAGKNSSPEIALALRSVIEGTIAYLKSEHPGRLAELRNLNILGSGEGTKGIDPWVEIPGGPYLTRAEASDFLNG